MRHRLDRFGWCAFFVRDRLFMQRAFRLGDCDGLILQLITLRCLDQFAGSEPF